MASKTGSVAGQGIGCIKWDVLSPIGPTKAHHIACVVNNILYVHGGIDKKGSTVPLNTLFYMDFATGIWQQLTVANSPALSHHACIVLRGRYIVTIGGWNGKARTSDVFIFDVQGKQWRKAETSGFPEGAGLSSHTVTLGENEDVLVVGREGSLRTQRRSGNAFILHGDVVKGVFSYKTHSMGASSRSGHSAHIISHVLVIYGGRDDSGFELHSGYKTGEAIPQVMSKVSALTKHIVPMKKPPCGRKQHIAISGSSGVFIHGGETFDGRSREPVGEMYYLQVRPSLAWYWLGTSGLGRAGHAICTDGESVFMHGGEGGKNAIHGDSYKLHVQ